MKATRELINALTALAKVPVENFGWETNPSQPIHGWSGHSIYVRDVLAAREALKQVQS